MSDKTYTWHQIALHEHELAFSKNNIATVEVNGKLICIGRFKEKLFAFPLKCPHAGGLLSEGFIDVLGNVVCPLHRYKFNIQNGRNTSGEGYYLKHWPVIEKDNALFVGMEVSGFPGLF